MNGKFVEANLFEKKIFLMIENVLLMIDSDHD